MRLSVGVYVRTRLFVHACMHGRGTHVTYMHHAPCTMHQGFSFPPVGKSGIGCTKNNDKGGTKTGDDGYQKTSQGKQPPVPSGVTISVKLADLGVPLSTAGYDAFDIWGGKDAGTVASTGTLTAASVASHGCGFFRLTAKK